MSCCRLAGATPSTPKIIFPAAISPCMAIHCFGVSCISVCKPIENNADAWGQEVRGLPFAAQRLGKSPARCSEVLDLQRYGARLPYLAYLNGNIVACKGDISAPLLSQIAELPGGCELDVMECWPAQDPDSIRAHHVLPS